MLVPIVQVKALLDEELVAGRAWARRQGLKLDFRPEDLALGIALRGSDEEPYLLEGVFDDYPTLPPSWRFLHPESGEAVGPAAYPRPADPYPRGSALIIDSGREGVVICAHFNRLAFEEEGGPHGDWGPLANWRNPNPSSHARAETVGEMLARIALEVSDSSGRKGAL